LKNYKLIIQYDGTNYCGWQIQLNGESVQGVVQDAIIKIARENVNLIGAGRTDAGVHDLGRLHALDGRVRRQGADPAPAEALSDHRRAGGARGPPARVKGADHGSISV